MTPEIREAFGTEAGIDISTMSKHLEVLRRQGVIIGEKVNNQVFYSLKAPAASLKEAEPIVSLELGGWPNT